jgi:hypothetical protein
MAKSKRSAQPKFVIKCPGGHLLPCRVEGRGRCTLDECCTRGEGTAHQATHRAHSVPGKPLPGRDTNEKPFVAAYAEETERRLDAKARMAVWDAVHPLPKVATKPVVIPGMSMFKYARERLAQAVPLAVERLIRKALLTPGPAGDAAADNILDRFGLTRRGEQPVEFNGPVQIVNLDPSRVPLLSQKPIFAADVQVEVPPRITTGEVNERVREGHAVPRDEEREADVGPGEGDDP